MQALNMRQLMKLSFILKKMGIKNNLTDYLFGADFDKLLKDMKATKINRQDNVFINIVVFFIENMYLAEREIMSLLAEINDVSIKEISNYDIDDLLISINKLIYGALPKNYRILAMTTIENYKKKITQVFNQRKQE
jgi:hypothetical protein